MFIICVITLNNVVRCKIFYHLAILMIGLGLYVFEQGLSERLFGNNKLKGSALLLSLLLLL